MPALCRLMSLMAPLLGVTYVAQAKTVKGPGVAVEATGPATIDVSGVGDDPDIEVVRRRYEALLLAPVPVSLLGGMFVLKGDFFKEERALVGDDAAWPSEDLRSPDVAATGAIFLPHAKEGAPRYFLLASRYGSMDWRSDARPMAEFIVGADIADDDMPYGLRHAAALDAETRVLVRYRQFPGFHRWLFLAGHKFTTASGLGLDVTIPSHIIVSWQTPAPTEAWKLYGGVRWVSREYPVDFGETRGWMEGFVTTRLLGIRRHLAGPLYLALEGGMQSELMHYIDEEGEERLVYETSFAPWGRLALETWIKTP